MKVIFLIIGLVVGIPALILFFKQRNSNFLTAYHPSHSFREGMLNFMPLSLLSFATIMLGFGLFTNHPPHMTISVALICLCFFPLAYSYNRGICIVGRRLGLWACWFCHGVFMISLSLLYDGTSGIVNMFLPSNYM